MRRLLPALVGVLLASCSPDTGDADRLRTELREERDVAEQLAGDLGRARARIRSMEREARGSCVLDRVELQATGRAYD